MALLSARVAGCTDPTLPHGLPLWLSVPAAGYKKFTHIKMSSQRWALQVPVSPICSLKQIRVHAARCIRHQLRRTGTRAATVGKEGAAGCRVKCRTSIPPSHLKSAGALLSKVQDPVHSSGVKSYLPPSDTHSVACAPFRVSEELGCTPFRSSPLSGCLTFCLARGSPDLRLQQHELCGYTTPGRLFVYVAIG